MTERDAMNADPADRDAWLAEQAAQIRLTPGQVRTLLNARDRIAIREHGQRWRDSVRFGFRVYRAHRASVRRIHQASRKSPAR